MQPLPRTYGGYSSLLFFATQSNQVVRCDRENRSEEQSHVAENERLASDVSSHFIRADRITLVFWVNWRFCSIKHVTHFIRRKSEFRRENILRRISYRSLPSIESFATLHQRFSLLSTQSRYSISRSWMEQWIEIERNWNVWHLHSFWIRIFELSMRSFVRFRWRSFSMRCHSTPHLKLEEFTFMWQFAYFRFRFILATVMRCNVIRFLIHRTTHYAS